MPLLVAVSRLYRGMHHPSDVMGAALLTALLVPLMWFVVRPNADLAATEKGTETSTKTPSGAKTSSGTPLVVGTSAP
jgi:undecaprenyl-diphosphatase